MRACLHVFVLVLLVFVVVNIYLLWMRVGFVVILLIIINS